MTTIDERLLGDFNGLISCDRNPVLSLILPRTSVLARDGVIASWLHQQPSPKELLTAVGSMFSQSNAGKRQACRRFSFRSQTIRLLLLVYASPSSCWSTILGMPFCWVRSQRIRHRSVHTPLDDRSKSPLPQLSVRPISNAMSDASPSINCGPPNSAGAALFCEGSTSRRADRH
jgi:hypothetical protein